MTTRRDEILTSRIKPVGTPQPPLAPRAFDAHAAVELLDALMGSGAMILYTGEVRTRNPALLEAVGDAGALWGRFLAFLGAFHDWGRWSMAKGIPDSVVRDAALEQAGRVAEEIGQAAADVLATWMRSRWMSGWRCCWCGGRSGVHESKNRVLP